MTITTHPSQSPFDSPPIQFQSEPFFATTVTWHQARWHASVMSHVPTELLTVGTSTSENERIQP